MITPSQLTQKIAITVGAAAGLAGVGALVLLRRPLPQTSGTVQIPRLQNRANVLRDEWGVPHIYAETHEDLFVTLGYVHAQDRLWQMDVNRRTGHGQLAELFGAIALGSDRFARTMGFGRVVRREVELLEDAERAIIEAYVSGINTFIETHQRRLPVEYTFLRHEPRLWDIADVLIWSKVIALNLSGNWTTELLNAHMIASLGPERAQDFMTDYPEDHPITVPNGKGKAHSHAVGTHASNTHTNGTNGTNGTNHANGRWPLNVPHGMPSLTNDGQGSNGWVVSGERSNSGKPLLANDPHLLLLLPSLWYEVHLEGGDYAVSGVTFPGMPPVIIGHNAHIAWGITNGMTDVQDLYVERFDAANTMRYAWGDGWEDAELVREEIYVRGQSEPVVEEVRVTRHGPIVSAIAAPQDSPLAPKNGFFGVCNNQPVSMNESTSENAPIQDLQAMDGNAGERYELALRWTALEPGRVTQAALALNRARNWAEFRHALANWDSPVINFVYADTAGHYGYALAGHIPIRAKGDGLLPMPGWDGQYEWVGYIPNDELPATYDPPAGFVINSNNRITDDEYAYSASMQGNWFSGYRAARIQELLLAVPRHDVGSFGHIQQDTLSLPGLELARLLDGVPLYDPLEQQARDLLVAWNGYIHPESAASTIYTTMRYHLERRAFAELGDIRYAQTGLDLFGTMPCASYLDRRVLPDIMQRIAQAHMQDGHDPWLGEEHTWTALLQECMAITVAELRSRLGNKPHTWHYGRIHKLMLRHPLGSIPGLAPLFNRGTWPTGGDIDTVCMGYIPRDSTDAMHVAPSYRMICDTGDWDASVSILSSGQSGHPASRHYTDMVELWRSGKYHPMLWSRSRVEEHTIATLLLEPGQVSGA